MSYIKTKLKNEFVIKSIVTIHYFEYSKNFAFTGESHDFWELVYVDKGEINATADDKVFRLNQGEVIFHKPNEFHNLSANGIVAPNLVIVSFECKSAAMKFFSNKIFSVTKQQKNLLSEIVKEATKVYKTPLGDPLTKQLIVSDSPNFGGEQTIRISLELLLLSLHKNNILQKQSLSVLKDRLDTNIIDEVIDFLNENIGQKLCFPDVVKFSKISSTKLKVSFKERENIGIMKYYNRLKIDRAKLFIREDNYNFTQISNLLGFESIHYFSHQFKKLTQMTPTEYARSVKVEL